MSAPVSRRQCVCASVLPRAAARRCTPAATVVRGGAKNNDRDAVQNRVGCSSSCGSNPVVSFWSRQCRQQLRRIRPVPTASARPPAPPLRSDWLGAAHRPVPGVGAARRPQRFAPTCEFQLCCCCCLPVYAAPGGSCARITFHSTQMKELHGSSLSIILDLSVRSRKQSTACTHQHPAEQHSFFCCSHRPFPV